MSNVAICISMYREYQTVEKSLMEIRRHYKDQAYCIVVQSRSGSKLNNIKKLADQVFILPDLSRKLETHKVSSFALTRNFGKAFSILYSVAREWKYIVAMCGDTLISDAENFDRRYEDMQNQGKLACISQAIGQNFHAPDADPVHGICGGRFQLPGITDFMPQLFIVEGKIAVEKKAFAEIPVVNEFTCEHCLGDELNRVLEGKFHENVIVLNPSNVILAQNAYGYNDGTSFHVR